MSLSDDRLARITIETAESLISNRMINSVPYYALKLDGPGVADGYDPAMQVTPWALAGYWPGGIEKPYLTRMLQLDLDLPEHILSPPEQTEQDVMFMRELTTKARVGSTAMERYFASDEPETVNGLRHVLGDELVPELMEHCKKLRAPMSVLMVFNVDESEIIGRGERVARMFYVSGTPLSVALRQIADIGFSLAAEEN